MPAVVTPAVQTLKVASPPLPPYVLTGTVPLETQVPPPHLGVKKGSTWYVTEQELIAQIEGVDYWHVKARIDSGVSTSFDVDVIDSPTGTSPIPVRDANGVLRQGQLDATINQDADDLANLLNGVQLELYNAKDNETLRVSLTGGVTLDQAMWSGDPLSNARGAGWFVRGNLFRTYYKHVTFQPGGKYGYLHVFLTVMADSPEVQVCLNWHNSGVEQQTTLGPVEVDIPAEGEPPHNSDTFAPRLPFGQAHCRDILFTRIRLLISPTIPPADGYSPGWTWTPQFTDPANNVSANALVKAINNNNPNRLHVVPITFERPFFFAIHPSGYTPYGKHVVGMADWSKDLGGWNFTRLGLPDWTALSSAAAGMSLIAESTSAKNALANLTPWTIEGAFAIGLNGLPLWPASWSAYGGLTSGDGMWPHYGCKWAWTAEKAAYELLLIEMLRVRCRSYGALYYNVSGSPVAARQHAPGGSAPWSRFDRRFTRTGSGVQDAPFRVTAAARQMTLADYNPGPVGGFQNIDGSGDPTPNVPDWYVDSATPGTPGGVPADTLVVGSIMAQAHTAAPSGRTDLTVPVIIQLQGGGAFNSAKSVTFRLTGTGDVDQSVVEDVVFTGPASSPPAVQAKQTAASYKTITRIEIVAVSGSLLSTELFTVGRASQTLADYSGSDNITSMDNQHWIRAHSAVRSLALLSNHPIARLYLYMDAADEHMAQWEGSGQAKKLFTVENGANFRGNNKKREFGWAMDVIASAYAFAVPQFGESASRTYWRPWFNACRDLARNTVMVNHLFQATQSKEYKQTPYGDANGGEGRQVYFGSGGRDAAYFIYALYILCNAKSHLSGSEAGAWSALLTLIKDSATGMKDLQWHVADGGAKPAPHTFIPVAARTRGGVLVRADEPILAGDVFSVYANQAALPAVNAFSGCLINPPVYPPVDDDLYVAELAGNVVPTTPLTLLRNDTNSGGAGLLPTPVDLTILTGTTFNNTKHRVFRVTGTTTVEQGSGVIVDYIQAIGNGQATQRLRTSKHFRTVTEIKMLTSGEAVTAGFGADAGTLVAGEKFRFGTGKVGLKYDNSNSTWPTYAEGYQLAYLLAIHKKLAAADADQIVQWYTSAASPALAKAAMLTWNEYTGGPTGRLEQWAPLLQEYRNA